MLVAVSDGQAALLLQAAYDATGVQLERAPCDRDAAAHEILIGEPGRPETETARQLPGTDPLLIAAVGEKLVILGSTPAYTRMAAETFLRDYAFAPELRLPGGLCAVYGVEERVAYTDYVNGNVNANDPWVIRDGSRYYYCWSTGNGAAVARCETLAAVADAEQRASVVWTAEPGRPWSQGVWAPELHKIDGTWHIYLAADDGDNEHHRMYVLRGTSADPTDRFELVGKLGDSTDEWAIDGTVIAYGGELYFCWSGWDSKVNVSQNLYIAHMSDPCTIDGERVMLSKPDYRWEMQGANPRVNEGPVAVIGDGVIHLIYSASGCWTDDYCLGQLTWRGGDLTDPANWEKSPVPVFSKQPGAYGPGHCSFTEAVDGTLWMVYHANRESGTGVAGRSLRMQSVQWDGRILSLGKPASLSEIIPCPYLVPAVSGRIR